MAELTPNQKTLVKSARDLVRRANIGVAHSPAQIAELYSKANFYLLVALLDGSLEEV